MAELLVERIVGHRADFDVHFGAAGAIEVLEFIHLLVAYRAVKRDGYCLRYWRANAGEGGHSSHDVDAYRAAFGLFAREELRAFSRGLRFGGFQAAHQLQINELHLRFLLEGVALTPGQRVENRLIAQNGDGVLRGKDLPKARMARLLGGWRGGRPFPMRNNAAHRRLQARKLRLRYQPRKPESICGWLADSKG